MVLPASDLPDDVDTLKAMILAMAREQAANETRLATAAAEIARLEAVEKSANERIANLTSILKVLQRTQHGKRSERLRLAVNDEQVSFAFEEVETGLSEIQSELDRAPRTSRSVPHVRAKACRSPRTHRGSYRAGNPGRLRGSSKGFDRRRPLRAAGRRATEVPGHRDAPPQIRLPGS
ncbi:transposase [Rhizobium mongolense]|uniref:Transposase TnpC homeodomain domain-containing protein n=1 Tax=Rhizobium mongolense TaxID=57676 RepID=A0ABR6IYR4_9HYPH|nr:transposase [Rhizobium mongolense]MBB4233067.1 hypothetical protein [Rhizobium mongolense]